MISASPNSIARSSLEEMLDSLRRRDEAEHSRDLPPALPSRPTSKARLPKRLIQAKLAMEHAVSYDSNKNKNKKPEVKLVTGGSGRSFGEKKEAAAVGDQRLSENGGATLATSPETEWNHIINHFAKNKLGVWCKPPQKDLWEFVKIEETMGEEVSVVLSDGSAITISTGEILPANEKNLDDVDDLVELCYLNEPSVLHNLKYRYSRDVIYSKAGNVLLAVNPFKEVKIYGNDFVTAYKDKKSNKPHVYATADAAYRDMMKDGGNQSIIISGVSGSGKTETSKFAMQYLTSVGSQNNNKIKNKLIQANCILEAFGNAKTSKNLNSSRFGKLIDINYNAEGIISGASIQALLLEKSRVSRLRRGERSYHIFYQICAGAPPILKDMLSLKMASEYKILNQSGCLKINGVDDADNFIMLVDAFDTFGIPHEVQESVFELVAAILWLGNISFVVIDKEEHVVPKADEASRNAARLMGCKTDDLIDLLSTNGIHNTTTPLTLQQATVKRDALAKFIYDSLFNWLVEEINTSLKGDEQHARHTISIIDIYGFESFQKNSFPQLLINYADERLQRHFIHHLCKLEQEQYELDGIHWKNVESEDNEECLDLFEQNPTGLISILDEGSNSSKATDETFTDKIRKHLSSNSRFSCEKGTFRIRHFAGEVPYDASGLLEQNSDKLQFDIIQLLSSCKKPLNHLASGLVKQDQTTSQSAFVKFKDHLYKIIEQLENSKQHFIRCIKPNIKQLAGNFENGIVWEQLKHSQVMDILQISKSRYPISYTHQEFATRFGCLLSHNLISTDPLRTSVAILQHYRVPTQTYRVGSTKLFFQGQVDVLENLRQEVLEGTRVVENGFLDSQVVPESDEWTFGIVTLQSFVRGENARREFNVLKKQNKGNALSSLDEHMTTIVNLQSVVRGWLARKYFNHMQRWKQAAIDSSESRRRSDSTNSELKGSSQENIEDLQKRVAKAESLLRERDLENTALREQVRQFEARLSEYENKTKAVEEMWQSQMATLQMSLSAAKKTLGSGISDGQTGRPDGSASPNYYDSEDNISGIPTPVQMTPLRSGHNRRENGVISNTVDYLSKEFEQRKQTFDNDAKAVINVTPGRPPSSKQIEDYKSLKKKFEIWKKEYKHRLREAKTTLVNAESGGGGGGGASGGGDRRGRHWWGKLSSKRGKERAV
ncbi:putative myosin ATPase [Helianthus annuus]|nr:putative myosin ATPase [Helianthus annuus]